MVRRIMALLLLAAWQMQGAVPPHFHAGMSADGLIAHGTRRHVHLSHKSHGHHDRAHQHVNRDHGHSHPQATPSAGHRANDVAAPPTDHDDDAVYLTDESLANGARTSPQVEPLSLATFAASVNDAISSTKQRTSAPPRYGGQVPAFLSITRLLL